MWSKRRVCVNLWFTNPTKHSIGLKLNAFMGHTQLKVPCNGYIEKVKFRGIYCKINYIEIGKSFVPSVWLWECVCAWASAMRKVCLRLFVFASIVTHYLIRRLCLLCASWCSTSNLCDAGVDVVSRQNVLMVCLKAVKMDLLCLLSFEDVNGSDTKQMICHYAYCVLIRLISFRWFLIYFFPLSTIFRIWFFFLSLTQTGY